MLLILNQVLVGKCTFMQLEDKGQKKQLFDLIKKLLPLELTILQHPKGKVVLTGSKDISLYCFPPFLMDALQVCLQDEYQVVAL